MIKEFKLWESSNHQPEKKYPVDKCLDLSTVSEELGKMHKINLHEIPCGVGGKYNKANFYSWVGEKIVPIFPIPNLADIYYEIEKERYKKVGMDAIKHRYFERDSIYELPNNYDSKKDTEEWYLKKAKFKANMELMTKKQWDDNNDQHIDFGPKSNEWVNVVLHKIYELYPQYYKNGKIRIWNGEDEFGENKNIYDYPIDKSYFLSDIENWISDTFDVDTKGLCEWILQSNFIEGRWWMKSWLYDIENKNFRGKTAPKNIIIINDILKQIYKENRIKIFFDYYKKIDDKQVYD